MIKIEHPKSYSLNQIRPLFVDFINKNPDLLKEWISLETRGGAFEERADLDEISQKVQKYLSDNCEVLSSTGLIFAFGDFRKLLWEQIIETK